MSKTLSGTYTINGYILSAASQGSLNPVTVTGSIDTGSGTNAAALYGQTPAAWSVTNLGSITGDAVAGVALAAGGTFVNGVSAYLGGHYGIWIAASPGSVTNSGTIAANNGGKISSAAAAIGAWLTGGGDVTNLTNGQISGQGWGVAIQGGTGSVLNTGVISGGAQDGVYVNTGAVTNQAPGRVSGVYGIVVKTTGSVVNSGSVTGGTSGFQAGVYVASGSVTNQSSGEISGAYGVFIAKGGSLLNDGSVTGIGKSGGFLTTGTVTNQGAMTGVWGVVVQGGTGTVVNSGTLSGTVQSGAYLTGGYVSNAASGLIEGASGIVIKTAAGTVANSGQIEAAGTIDYAVYTVPGFVNRVIDNPGATFFGTVTGGNTVGSSIVSTLELGAASLQGTLTGLGSQFIDFGQVTVDPGAAWSLAGANSLAAGITLLDQGALTLNGAVLFDAAASTISSTLAATASLTVTGAGGTLIESTPLVVGANGAGSMLISNHGSASALATTSQAAITLGASAAADGTLEVTGAGSGLTAVGQLTVGQAGGGQLRIEGGSTVSAGGDSNAPSQGVDLGVAAGGSGEVVVTGPGSKLTNSGAFIVGDAGLGSLSIDVGGSVSTTPGVGTTGLIIANTASASGSSVDVSGAGSDLSLYGTIIVGAAGAGSLSLSQSATVTAESLDEASAAGGSGQIGIVGAGSDLIVAGTATIADQSVATLSILNGGSFQAGFLNLGVGDATGALTVAGPGTDFHITNDMTVGHNGVFSIGNAVTVFIDGNFDEIGAVNQGDGSLIDPSTVTNSSPHGGGGGSQIVASGSITNDSTYFVGDNDNGSYILTTPLITGTGVLEADPATNAGAEPNLVLNAGSIGSGQTLVFGGQSAEITLGSDKGTMAIAGLAAGINGFVAGDTLVVTTTAAAGFQLNGSVVSVVDNVGGATEGSLVFANATFANTAFNTGGALVDQVACFAAGTRLATESGMLAVEALRVGDRVLTHDGAVEPIVWIGQRTLDCARHPTPEHVWPMRVAADAFGTGKPSRDLYLSPDHAVFVDGVLVPVKLLCDGTTIAQLPRPRVTYFHVELPRHAVILAEGLTVESYLDSGDRADFAGQPVMRLFPHLTTRRAPAAALSWEARGAAPLVTTGQALRLAREWIARRAAAPTSEHSGPVTYARSVAAPDGADRRERSRSSR